MIDAEAMQARMRMRQVEERRHLAKKLGIKPVAVPAMLPGESNREYCDRIGKLGDRLVRGTKSETAS